MKVWIVTCVDYGETCDGKARALQICKSKEEATAYVNNDIENWADDHAGENITVDFGKLSARYVECDNGCEWNIEEVEIDVGDILNERLAALIGLSSLVA